MKLSYSDYVELPAPLGATIAALSDPSIWARLLGAERLGELWRFGDELYTLSAGGPPREPHWRAQAATGRGPTLAISLQLADAVITTHAAVRVEHELGGLAMPWQVYRARHELRRAVRRAASLLAALLRADEPVNGGTADAPPRTRLVAEASAQPEATMRALAPHPNSQRGAGGERTRSAAVKAPAPGAQHSALQLTASVGASTATVGALAGAPALARATPRQAALAGALHARYPLTVEHFVAMEALDHLERVARLEEGWERIMRGECDRRLHTVGPVTARPDQLDYDLIYAGGGLGLLHAAVMATRHGRRVLVFDRGEVGCAHREWNISREELGALVASGVVSWGDLEGVVMRQYRDGVVRFFGRQGGDVPGGELVMPDLLNVALDAGALLRLLRHKLEAAGGTVLSGRAFSKVHAAAAGPMIVAVELEEVATGACEQYTGRLLLDGMGSTSPLALLRHRGRPFAGVCPTVGTVASGFVQGEAPDEVDLERGDILVTVADAQRGEQLLWEGFPGRGDELTVYLFYYATLARAGADRPARGQRPGAPRYSLLELFEQYFTLLPTYKRPGPHFGHLRPVYGYIPGRHSLRQQEAPLLRGVLPVGDSAAQQSPLTFCGFGSHVRNLRRTTGLLSFALDHDLLQPEELAHVSAFQINVALNWTFSRFMQPWERADDVNRLQNMFLDVLRGIGPERASRFYQDRMSWDDYNRILAGIRGRDRQVLRAAWSVLGPASLAQWAGDYLRFGLEAALAATAQCAGSRAESLVTALADGTNPSVGLRVRAHYAAWRAMGWL